MTNFEFECEYIANFLSAGLHIVKKDTSPESVVAALRPLVAAACKATYEWGISWSQLPPNEFGDLQDYPAFVGRFKC